MSYNGWKNKETWLVNLWLGDYFQGMQEDGYTIDEDCIRETVSYFVDFTDKIHGFIQDILNCALDEIDYRELAEFYKPLGMV